MIRLYLVRHAADEDLDGARRLKRRSKRRFRRIARAFKSLEEPVQIICTGRKRHVKETADLLARTLRGEVVELKELSSRKDPDVLLRALAVRCQGLDGIVLVSHRRQLRRLLATFGIRKGELRLPKGSIVRIDVDSLSRPRTCVPRFRVKPSPGELEDAFLGARKAS
jgi:phosphohistidine phosphatase SixA